MATTLAKLMAKFVASVVDTGGKFATAVVDTVGAPLLEYRDTVPLSISEDINIWQI